MATQTKPYTSAVGEKRSRSYVSSSVGTKVLMAITGLLLILYLVLHLLGNLLFYFGPAIFNGYSHLLISNPLIIPVEIGLAAVFVLHIYKAATNFVANRRARPAQYYRKRWAGRPSRKSIASSTMIFTGLITILFVVIHLQQFRLGAEYFVEGAAPGSEVRDLYRLELEVFSNVLNVAFYVFCMVVVGFHLWHGFASAFSSLGADHPRFTPRVLLASKILAMVIAGGFITIPVFVYFSGGAS